MGDIMRTDIAALVDTITVSNVSVPFLKVLVLALCLDSFQFLFRTLDRSVVCLDGG